MRIIKPAPGQNGLAMVLVIIAVAAIGVTVWRCRQVTTARAMPRAIPATGQARRTPTVVEISSTPAGNPFRQPLWARASNRADSAEGARIRAGSDAGRLALPALGCAPMPVSPPGNAGELVALPGTTTDDAKPMPDLTLLATVSGAGKTYAVIRIGASESKVVRVGDVLDGGFRVKEIRTDIAILTNGADVLVARRENAQGSQATQEKTDGKI